MTAGFCEETLQPRGVYESYHPRTCGRKAVEDGLCSLHLKARRRREAKRDQWKAEQKATGERLAEAQRLTQLLNELGIPDKPKPEYYTGNLVITPEAASWLIERIA